MEEETNAQVWTVDTFDGVNVSMESGINCWSLERNDEEGEGIEVMEINIGNENLEEDILVTALTNLQVVPVAPESLDIPTGYRVLSTASPHEGNENLEEDNSYELLEVQSTESMEWNDEDTEEVMNTYEGNENLEEDNSYELLEVQSIVKPEASSCNTIRERLICNTPNNSFLRHHKTQLVFPSQTNDVEMEEYAQHPQQTIVEGSNECVCNLELDNIPVLALPQESNLGLPHSKSMLPTEESGIEVKTKQISVTNSVIISPSSLPYQSSQEMDAFLSRSVAESQHGGLFAITYKKGGWPKSELPPPQDKPPNLAEKTWNDDMLQPPLLLYEWSLKPDIHPPYVARFPDPSLLNSAEMDK